LTGRSGCYGEKGVLCSKQSAKLWREGKGKERSSFTKDGLYVPLVWGEPTTLKFLPKLEKKGERREKKSAGAAFPWPAVGGMGVFVPLCNGPRETTAPVP